MSEHPLAHDPLSALLASDHVSPATRAALERRLAPGDAPPDPSIFSDADRTTLRAVVDRMFPAIDDAPRPDLATAFEAKLAAPHGKGWRYESLPDDVTTHRQLLRLIDETALDTHGGPFDSIPEDEKDAVLTRVQRGQPDIAAKARLDVERAFEELLSSLTECYACEPQVQIAFGYVGFADLPGWERIGLDDRDDREIPSPVRAVHG